MLTNVVNQTKNNFIMKKNLSILAALIFAVIFSNEANAQKFSKLDASPMDVASFPSNYRVSDKVIKIIYSRPQLKNRNLAKLAPAGKKWRVGANEATEVTFYKDVTFGGKAVKAGTYTMYAIPGEKEWTIALSSQLNVWGAYFHKDENDVARVKGKVSQSDETIEAFSIAIGEDMTIHMAWGNTIVSVPVK